MNATDKFPEEMLEDIRERACRAANALGELSVVISEMRDKYPTHPAFAEMRWWWSVAVSCMDLIGDISVHAEEQADAEEEGGGE